MADRIPSLESLESRCLPSTLMPAGSELWTEQRILRFLAWQASQEQPEAPSPELAQPVAPLSTEATAPPSQAVNNTPPLSQADGPSSPAPAEQPLPHGGVVPALQLAKEDAAEPPETTDKGDLSHGAVPGLEMRGAAGSQQSALSAIPGWSEQRLEVLTPRAAPAALLFSDLGAGPGRKADDNRLLHPLSSMEGDATSLPTPQIVRNASTPRLAEPEAGAPAIAPRLALEAALAGNEADALTYAPVATADLDQAIQQFLSDLDALTDDAAAALTQQPAWVWLAALGLTVGAVQLATVKSRQRQTSVPVPPSWVPGLPPLSSLNV